MGSERKDPSEDEESSTAAGREAADPVAEAIGELRESLPENARDEQALNDEPERLEREH